MQLQEMEVLFFPTPLSEFKKFGCCTKQKKPDLQIGFLYMT
jgi:hypothetical protein